MHGPLMQSNLVNRRRALQRIALASALPFASRPADARLTAVLDETFDRLVKAEGYDNNGPGLACLVQQSGWPVFMRCVGLATLHNRAPVTSKTMFELASVS